MLNSLSNSYTIAAAFIFSLMLVVVVKVMIALFSELSLLDFKMDDYQKAKTKTKLLHYIDSMLTVLSLVFGVLSVHLLLQHAI